MKRKLSDGQYFHQYQQNKQSPRTFKSLNLQETNTYDVGNPGLGLGRVQQCDGFKPINGIPFHLLIIGSSKEIYK